MRILVVEPKRYGEELRQLLQRRCRADFVHCEGQSDFLASLGAADYSAVFVRLGLSVDREAIDRAPTLRWIVTPTTGLDHIDCAEAERRRVRVISLRGQTDLLRKVASTAEHTWALLLSLVRRLPHAHRDVLAENWRREPFLASELAGKTLGILGLGRLGQMVARYGEAFGMSVIAHDSASERFAETRTSVRACSLPELLAESDVLSVHLPLDASTAGLLDQSRLRALKRGALLINTARGELIE
jgi:D-3-phosphoglycerate dehydrogenase / 2-oxoglutarate reductase